ncbi:hypothetical protein FKM82_002260 [Ascaphus truei]
MPFLNFSLRRSGSSFRERQSRGQGSPACGACRRKQFGSDGAGEGFGGPGYMDSIHQRLGGMKGLVEYRFGRAGNRRCKDRGDQG